MKEDSSSQLLALSLWAGLIKDSEPRGELRARVQAGGAMLRSAMFMLQFSTFFAGFFFCAAASMCIRHFSSLNWVSPLLLGAVFLAWSFRYSEKLRRKFPELGAVRYSD